MATVSIEDRFHGTCNLVILHLRRAAKSNDLDRGFAAAREMHMIDESQEAFLRHYLALDEQMQTDCPATEPITDELIKQLQRCVLRLNTADPA